MRPVPIPDRFVGEGRQRRVLAGPGGDLTGDVRPVEVLVARFTDGTPVHLLRLALDDGDLETLAKDPHFWLLIWGDHLHPFSLEMTIPDSDEAGERA